jgi:hypothetical protein
VIITGYEIFNFGGDMNAYGFGLLEEWGYIDYVPEVYEWWAFSAERKRQWVLDMNAEITRRNDGRK